MRLLMSYNLLLAAGLFLSPVSALAASHATINSNLVLVIDSQEVFPIGFTMPPPPEGKTPEGKNAIEELASAGATFLRTGAQGGGWDEATLKREQEYLDAAARYGMHCMPFLREHAAVSSKAQELQLRQLVERFKNQPGLGAWKGEDEPEWGKRPLPPLVRAYRVIKETDPNHPVVIIQAPRGTVESLREYNVTGDILGADIYPISYPPGIHSLLTNRTISLVGDHTRIMMDAAGGKLPVWMVLQISFSGVLKPGKTLRFPTFPEERFMTYEAIINGARGLLYFGGGNEKSLSEADLKLGWNWTFWKRVLRPVIEEIGAHSPLYPALVAPDSTLPIRVSGADGIEFRAREVNGELFLLACKREGDTSEVEFSGLPASARTAEVLYEAPRAVEAKDGKFKDWFAPFEVHVYRLKVRNESSSGSF
jgi:hypothetical protein